MKHFKGDTRSAMLWTRCEWHTSTYRMLVRLWPAMVHTAMLRHPL